MRWPWQRKKEERSNPGTDNSGIDAAARSNEIDPGSSEVDDSLQASNNIDDAGIQPTQQNQNQASTLTWFQRLTDGLARTSNQVSEGISSIFNQRKLDDDMGEELEDLLISSDVGVDAASRISASFAKGRFDKKIDPGEVRAALAEAIRKELETVEIPVSYTHLTLPTTPYV